MTGEKLESQPGDDYELRSICLALLDSDIREDDEVEHRRPRPRRCRRWWSPTTCAATPRPTPGPSSTDPPEAEEPLPPLDARREVGALLRKTVGQPPLAAGGVHQPHPLGDDPLSPGAPALGHRPGLPLRRAPQARGLRRSRHLLLPGHRLHRRGGAGPRAGDVPLPGRRRGGDPGRSAGRWPTPRSSPPWWTTSTAGTARASPAACGWS